MEQIKKPVTDKDIIREMRGRTVLVTGADGFVGSHMTEFLLSCGADVRVFVRATSSGELRNIAHLKGKIKVYRGDLSDRHAVDSCVKDLVESAENDGTIIFHLAAQAHVGESWERPYETVTSNILGTMNLLQSVVDHKLPLHKFDTAGTSEEYGNVREDMKHHHDFAGEGALILHERSPINPKSIYATTKLAADFLTMNYYDAYGIPGVTTRMFNNYGPRQNPRYLTGTVITQALTKRDVVLGTLTTKRDFCYVGDGIRGHIHAALWGNPGEVYVYGFGKNIAVKAWAELILSVGEKYGYWKRRKLTSVEWRARPGKSDVEELLVDHEKLTALTGWAPSVGWEEGIAETIEWYSANREKWEGRVDW